MTSGAPLYDGTAPASDSDLRRAAMILKALSLRKIEGYTPYPPQAEFRRLDNLDEELEGMSGKELRLFCLSSTLTRSLK